MEVRFFLLKGGENEVIFELVTKLLLIYLLLSKKSSNFAAKIENNRSIIE